ncbi:NADH dehydrogenase [ubiquinone] iron-sulfur protein 6, mitochondrial [Galendromus occidentalis]|uniref:NADH dehydrogenase [ubiquinone] iron-sulfur protein 6, mitochondrial n=1 Tax=Galendromus occidentalis TaxID=34638 RepID=A0AAJ6VYE6_9ACAR|nr:NADH dehydrogenase [ubiquinone] iron-sulfur protein 6, mitochondrial [Galendromus occidentalis]
MSSPALKVVTGLRAIASRSTRCVSSLTPTKSEVETHTGQKYDKEDFRNVRFVGRPKQVNPNHAIKLIAEVPPIEVESRKTFCNGGDGALGHPKVFINLDKPGTQSCLYCGLRYVQKHHDH